MSKDPVAAPSQAQRNQTCSFLATYIRCSPLSHQDNGGARRDRTDDILLAKQALSQLSYGPITETCQPLEELVGPGRLELPTSRLSGVRSNHLSYGPFLDTPETPTARSGLRTLTREYVACEERETKAAKFRMFRAV